MSLTSVGDRGLGGSTEDFHTFAEMCIFNAVQLLNCSFLLKELKAASSLIVYSLCSFGLKLKENTEYQQNLIIVFCPNFL